MLRHTAKPCTSAHAWLPGYALHVFALIDQCRRLLHSVQQIAGLAIDQQLVSGYLEPNMQPLNMSLVQTSSDRLEQLTPRNQADLIIFSTEGTYYSGQWYTSQVRSDGLVPDLIETSLFSLLLCLQINMDQRNSHHGNTMVCNSSVRPHK